MEDIIHQGGQYSPVNIVLGGHYSLVNSVRGGGGQYSLVNNVRGDNFLGGQYSLLHRIVHHLLLLLLLLSNSVQTAYRETGVSNRSNSFTKIIYTGAYMILDAQKIFIPSPKAVKLQLCNLTSVSFRRHSCLLTCRTREVSFVH